MLRLFDVRGLGRHWEILHGIYGLGVWMDTAHAVSLKLVFDEGEGQSRVCIYSNIEVNQPLPKTAFSFDK